MYPSLLAPARSGASVAIVVALALALLPGAVSAQPVAKAGFMTDGSFILPTSGAPGAVEAAVDVAWSPSGEVHVVDERRGVVVFDTLGGFLRSYAPPRVDRLSAVVVDAEGWSFLLDSGSKTVFVFDSLGSPLHRAGAPGKGPGLLDDPVDVAIGPGGFLYVLDKGAKAVQVFSRDGTSVHEAILPGDLGDPRVLAVGVTGHVYVATGDTRQALLALPPLTESLGVVGQPLQVARIPLRGADLRDPVGLAVTPSGTVVVADRNDGVLWSADAAGGRPVGSDDRLYGGRGTGRGSFQRLSGLSLAGEDQLLALDRDGRKIERIRLILEGERTRQAVMDYPVRVQRVPLALDGAVLGTAPTGRGTSWFALAGPEGRGLRIAEAETERVRGVHGSRIGVPRPLAGGVVHDFSTVVERAASVAMNDTLAVVSEPREDRFHVFDLRSGTPIGVFGNNYRDERRLNDPEGVALFADGRVAVADRGNDRIVVFSPDLATLLGSWPMQDPAGVRVSPDGRLFAWNEEVAGRFDFAGGTFTNLPVQLSVGGVGAIAFDARGNVYAAQRGSSRVAIMDASLEQLLARVGPSPEVGRGDVLTVDGEGGIFATHYAEGRSAALHWGVDIPPVEGFTVRWGLHEAWLSWRPVTGSYVVGYRLEGAETDGSEGGEVAWRPLVYLDETVDELMVSEAWPSWYRLSVTTLTGASSAPSPVVPILHLDAFAAFEAGEWERADLGAAAAWAAIESGRVEADPGVAERLAWEGLVAASERGAATRVLEWHAQLGGELLQDRAFEHADRLARAHAVLGESAAAVDRAREALRVARLARPQPPRERLTALQRLVYDAAVVSSNWADVASAGEALLEAAPLNADAAFLASLARAHLETGAPERALELVEVALDDPAVDASSTRTLTVLGFLAEVERGGWEPAIGWLARIGDQIPGSLFTDFQIALARLRLNEDRPREAMAELEFLFEGTVEPAPLRRPIFGETVLGVYGRLLEEDVMVPRPADPAGAAPAPADASTPEGAALPDQMVREADLFMDRIAAAIPESAAAAWDSVTARAAAVEVAAETERQIGEGIDHFRDGLFRDALSFFQEAVEREDLSDDQRLISHQILAWALYSLGRVEEADEAYRGVFAVDPEFDLLTHVEVVRDRYELEIFTDEMLAHFSRVRRIL